MLVKNPNIEILEVSGAQEDIKAYLAGRITALLREHHLWIHFRATYHQIGQARRGYLSS